MHLYIIDRKKKFPTNWKSKLQQLEIAEYDTINKSMLFQSQENNSIIFFWIRQAQLAKPMTHEYEEDKRNPN